MKTSHHHPPCLTAICLQSPFPSLKPAEKRELKILSLDFHSHFQVCELLCKRGFEHVLIISRDLEQAQNKNPQQKCPDL